MEPEQGDEELLIYCTVVVEVEFHPHWTFRAVDAGQLTPRVYVCYDL